MSDELVKLAEGMTRTMLAAAQEQVTKAQAMLDQTQSMADIIMNQVRAQVKSNEEMDARFKQAGAIMLDAHRILNGQVDSNKSKDVNLQDAPLGLARLRPIAGVRPDMDDRKAGEFAANYGKGAERGRAADPDGHADLQRKMDARLRDAAAGRPRED